MSEEEKVKTVNVNIILLKSECNLDNRSEYIENYSDENVIVDDADSSNYFLYKNGRAGQKPSWVLEFDKNIWKDSIKDKFANTASEGLSVLKQVTHNDNKYLFAINFGQGWHNIIKDKIDDTFGIYTAIALIEQGANIRRAGIRNIASNPKNTEFQNAQGLSREAFNAELEDNDIIRHLNAVANYPTISSVIGKYGPLNIRMRFKESELPCWDYLDERLSTLIDLYENVQIKSDIVNKFFKGLKPLPSKKQNELLKEKDELEIKLNSHKKASNNFIELVENLIELTKEAPQLYLSANTLKKREMLKLIISNPTIKDGNISYKLNPVFEKVVNFNSVLKTGEGGI